MWRICSSWFSEASRPAEAAELLLIDKPAGISSFDVIRRLRRRWTARGERAPKMGHAGTLDPLASGLMLIGVGKGTKRLTEFLKLPKVYEADVLLGERRSTGDMAGIVLESSTVPEMDAHQIVAVLQSMQGTLTLPVSAYSAIKRNGVPMYKRARQAAKEGTVVTDVPIRDMIVHSAVYRSHTCSGGRCIVRVCFDVSSGTYIRSLAEEFGRRIGVPATLKTLRRTRIGSFDVRDATMI